MGDIAELLEASFDPYEEYLDQIYEINQRWARGKHMMKDGKCIAIKDMKTSHIQNCLKLWEKKKEYDLTPFKKELKKRL
jgi:hypothetical protein